MRYFVATVCTAVLVTLMAPAIAAAGASSGGQLAWLPQFRVDHVVVEKSERRLVLMHGEEVMRVYRVALGRYPTGPKVREGDARTPEGMYMLDHKLPKSDFYKAIAISYPNPRDLARAEALGVAPGGRIMIHGLPNEMTASQVGHPAIDWTQGCIAVTNSEMDEIWRMVEPGTPIEIRP